MRSYRINMSKSAVKAPRVDLEEIGPRIDWKLRRSQLASEDLYKEACKQVANVHKKKKVKNISKDRLEVEEVAARFRRPLQGGMQAGRQRSQEEEGEEHLRGRVRNEARQDPC